MSSIRSKLVFNALITIFGLIIMGSMGFYFTNHVAHLSMSIVDEQAIPIITINTTEKKMSEILIRLTVHTAVATPDTMEKLEQEINTLFNEIALITKEYKSLSEAETKRIKIFKKEWEEFSMIAQEALELSKDFTKQDALNLLVNKGKPLYDRALSISEEQVGEHQRRMAKVRDSAMDSRRDASILIVFFTFLAGSVAIFMGWWIIRMISQPVNSILEGFKKIADGDLTMQIDIKNDKDELGELARGFNNFIQKLRGMIKGIAENAETLTLSSSDLLGLSGHMTSGAEQTSEILTHISSSSESMNDNITSVASSADHANEYVFSIASMTEEMSSTFDNAAAIAQRTADNVSRMAQAGDEMSERTDTIAVAIEEMTITLNDVAKNTGKASRISQDANSQTEEMNEKMNTLISASKQIGKVLNVIKDIADQTNMLALNATIEAAGAGNAGKGFAVVANEVKELAKQSADATDEITLQIDQIQESINEAVKVIGEISTIINEIAGINEAIASSAEEQTAVASEISRSVADNAMIVKNVANDANESSKLVNEIAQSAHETSKTASEVAKHVDELSKQVNNVAVSSGEVEYRSQDITKRIQEINAASKEAAAGAVQSNNTSEELAGMAACLWEIVKKFRL